MLKIIRRVFSFADWQQTHPRDPHPGDMLDAQFDEIIDTIDDWGVRVKGAVGADGMIAAGKVGKASLAPELLAEIEARIAVQVEERLRQAETAAANAQAAADRVAASEAAAQAAAARAFQADARVAEATARFQSALKTVDAVRKGVSAAHAEVRSAADARIAADEHAAGFSEAWALTSRQWAEHMPDVIPETALAMMDITGDHWSARWWANQAANTVSSIGSGVYIGDSPPENPADGQLWWDSDTGHTYIWYVDLDSGQWVQINSASDLAAEPDWGDVVNKPATFPPSVHTHAEDVKKAGDTMTGNLTIAPTAASAQLSLRKSASGQNCVILGQNGALVRWGVYLGTTTAEAGANTGSNFAVLRFNDAGTVIDNVLTIARSTGVITMPLGASIRGVDDASDAAAGWVGEYKEAERALGSEVNLVSGNVATIVSTSLAAGDWEVHGWIGWTSGAGTSITRLLASVALSAAGDNTTPGASVTLTTPAVVTGAGSNFFKGMAGTRRLSITTTTTVYLVANAIFSVDTLGAWGKIWARRLR